MKYLEDFAVFQMIFSSMLIRDNRCDWERLSVDICWNCFHCRAKSSVALLLIRRTVHLYSQKRTNFRIAIDTHLRHRFTSAHQMRSFDTHIERRIKSPLETMHHSRYCHSLLRGECENIEYPRKLMILWEDRAVARTLVDTLSELIRTSLETATF